MNLNRSVYAQAVTVLLGVWLEFAPAVLGYTDTTAATSDRFAGPLIAAFAFVAASAITRGLRWCNVPVALWLLVGPLVLGFPLRATVSSVLVGLAVLALVLVTDPVPPERYAGGWVQAWRTWRGA